MKIPAFAISLLAATALSSTVHADLLGPAPASMSTSHDGSCVLKSVPEYTVVEDGKRNEKPGFSAAYKITESGELEEIWRSQRALWGNLSNCGEYLIADGSWGSDRENLSDVAIKFYHKGNLIRSYKVNELIKDRTKIEKSASLYWWQARHQSTPSGFASGHTYYLVLIDGTTYHFDYRTGEILATGTDRKASGMWPVRTKREKLGQEILQQNPEIQAFEEHFEFSRVSSHSRPDTMFSPLFRPSSDTGPHWSATFLTKERKNRPAIAIHVYAPIDEQNRIQLSFTPQDFLDLIATIDSSETLAAYLKRNPTEEICLFAQENSLYWDQIELNQLLKQAGKEPSSNERNHWIGICTEHRSNVFISSKEHLFLNRKTGELLGVKDGK